MAAASKFSERAFAWITEVENLIETWRSSDQKLFDILTKDESKHPFEILADSGDFGELDAMLAKELDKIMSGEFKKEGSSPRG